MPSFLEGVPKSAVLFLGLKVFLRPELNMLCVMSGMVFIAKVFASLNRFTELCN